MKILVTRPTEESELFAIRIAELNHTAIIEPLIEIEILKPIKTESFSNYDIIVISSKNAIKAIADLDKNLKLVIVGKNSTEYAKSLGFVNSIYGGETIVQLKKKLTSFKNILYLTGVDITDDLSSLNLNITRNIVYKTQFISKISSNLVNFITSPEDKAVVFFSSKTAEAFIKLIEQNNLNSWCTKIIALTLSSKIAHTLKSINFKKCYIAKKPDIKNMTNLIKLL